MLTGIRGAIICKRHFLRECSLLGASRAILTELAAKKVFQVAQYFSCAILIIRYGCKNRSSMSELSMASLLYQGRAPADKINTLTTAIDTLTIAVNALTVVMTPP
jgi:hypothetical protein